MKKIINKYFIYIIFLLTIFISSFLLSIFNLLGVSKNITNIIATIVFIIICFIIGFIKGKKSNKKGYLQGFKTGSILCFILLVIGLFNISIKTIIYYSILILSSILGATVGINKK